jgi:KUP system potassium uptake protein
MTLTSFFLVLVMILIWKSHILLVISYVLTIGSVELIFLSSVFYKFDQGGYLPLVFAAVLMTIMYVWNNVFRKKYYYEHKISLEMFKEIVVDKSFRRIPGLAMCRCPLFYQTIADRKGPLRPSAVNPKKKASNGTT